MQGNKNAQYNLGLMYANGEGTSQNYAKSIKWYKKAACNGDDGAQYNLGVLYANGEGVEKSYATAYSYWSAAAAVKNKDAISSIKTIIKVMTPEQIEEGKKTKILKI